MPDGGIALSGLHGPVRRISRRPDEQSAIRHHRAHCRMAALPYPAYMDSASAQISSYRLRESSSPCCSLC
ncbi:hypothetical protein C8256_21990 [Kluyvera genomosp. 2]|uniref:Uncharacterized protein n=1 Tax=Kluyvera genomosp. 2 TaxID=2774054 RepID=A0A2T2XWG8_9ENTR|nr:hypothetical protein C8256_21990 [Kluyvera genomosp. 2]